MSKYYVYGWQDIDSGEMIYIGQGKVTEQEEIAYLIITC